MLAAGMSPPTVKGSSRAVRPVSPWVVTEFIRVPVADHRRHCGDRGHGQGDGDPDRPVSHGQPPTATS
jgi:hypothetical protein